MTIVPGFAKDFVGRRRTVEMEVTPTSSILSKKASHLPGQVRWRIPFWGLQGLPGHALQIDCAEFSSC
jgi:hypothetical protein